MAKLSRGFRALWLSTAASNLGDGLVLAAAPLLAATLTRDPVLVAGMTVAQFLPWVLFTLPAGALVDRWDRRGVIVVGNALRAVGFALLALSLFTPDRHLGLLYAAVFVAGLAETLVDNAALTVPPRLLARAELEQANGRLFATQSVINTFVGPPLGAAVFAISAALSFWTTAGAFAVAAGAAFLLPRLRPDTTDRSPGQSLVRDLEAGWQYFWGHELLRRVALVSASINLFGTATGSVLVLLATGPLGVSAKWYGVFIAVPAAGAILGSLSAGRILHRVGGGPVTWSAALVPAAAYLVLGITDSPVVAAAALFLSGIATACNQIVVSTLRQASVPDQLLGRVTAGYRLLVLGAVPVGAIIGGVCADQLGLRSPYLISAAGLTVAVMLLAPGVTSQALREAEQHTTEHPVTGAHQ
jgi:MFS family permease